MGHFNLNNVETDYSETYWDNNTHALTDSNIYTNTISNNNVIRTLLHTWNSFTNSYDTTGQILCTYDVNHNQISWVDQSENINNTGWYNNDSVAYTYDLNNNQTGIYGYLWVNVSGFYNSRDVLTYDANNNLLSEIRHFRNGNTWFGDSTYYYYGAVTDIQQVAENENSVSIYPNPSNGLFNLSISKFDNFKMHTIEVYNAIGNCVHHQIATSANCQIDLSSLPIGIYNISISSNEGFVNKRVVIVK